MTEINKAGETNSLGHIDIPQGEYRSQIDALTDAVRQLGGNPEISPGSTVVNDPLSAPYILYVNSYTGSDKFVTGDYASADDGTFEQKMRRIANQRLECGYTEARPFKTINRAAIEAGIITSKDYLDLPGNLCGDLVTIVVQSGVHDVINGPAGTTATVWADGYEPDEDDLQAFNAADGGVILPRGCSVVSMDLRKTNLRPTHVPAFDQENADYSNRTSIFRVTGTGYYYGFTFLDKPGHNESHHLLDTFSFAGRDRVDAFYAKILASFGASSGVSTLARTRNSEVRIVGPQPDPGFQSETTDTVESASPYIYNCSIRSVYGMCGIFANGAEVEGFKSMVVAQYTAISLQKDMRCWQRYNAGTWATINQADYNTYINETPDNVRMDPRYRSIHVRCVNRAIIQEVSVFAIGQGIHHAVESGGELTITNSNSNFGGCAALAEGFVDYSFETDKNWNVSRIRVQEDLESLENAFQTYFLGTIEDSVANNATAIQLKDELEGDENNRPNLLRRDGFSLNNYGGVSYVWIENPNGNDYYAPLDDPAWETNAKDVINVSATFLSALDNDAPTGNDSGPLPPIAGKRIYVRRLRDVRSPDQRRYSLICNNTSSDSRNIIRDYGLQTDISSSSIDFEIEAREPIIVANVGTRVPDVGVQRTNDIELRRAAASDNWDDRGEYYSDYHRIENYYRAGDTVRYRNKHWKCIEEHIATPNFDTSKWDESFVHMESDFAAEDYFKNAQPVIIFDKDKDNTLSDSLLGYTNADFKNDNEVRMQLRTATDYLGLYSFLRSLGFTDNESHTILLPKPAAVRERDPNNPLDGISGPSGAANSWDNWIFQMRRPSNIRLFGQAFEWAGQLNYTKALPQYQRDLSASNKFTYFFTNQLGGRVYVSGFNEEGFEVTAAGLTDLQTGETVSPDGLGSDGRDPNAPEVFNKDVVINGQLTVNKIDSTQKSLVKDRANNANLPSEGRGMSWIAPMETIADIGPTEALSLDATNEAGSNTGPSNKSGYSGASFVTPYYLDTWRGANKLLSSTEGPVKVFVNPRAVAPAGSVPDSTANESRNYNTTDIGTLLGEPPTTPENAVTTLRLAIEYANATLSPTTQIQYYLGPGLYYEGGRLTFEHDVVLVGYDYSTNQFLTDGQGGGAKPWLGTTNSGRGNAGNLGRFPENTLEAAIQNPDNMPVFLSNIVRNPIFQGTRDRLIITTLQLAFRKSATLQGLMWWGLSETLRAAQGTEPESDTKVTNSWFGTLSAGDLQTIKNESNRAIFNAAVFRIFAGTNIYGFYNETPITTNGLLRTRDVAFAFMGLPRQSLGPGNESPLISSGASAVLQLSGISLIGNNHLRSDITPTGFTGTKPLINGQTVYRIIGHAQAVVNGASAASDSVLTFTPCYWGNRQENVAGEYNYNLTQFNWHLITSDYQYPSENDTMHGVGAPGNEDDNGPGFKCFLGRQILKRRLGRFSYHDYRAPRDDHRTGFAGFFGFYYGQSGVPDTAGPRAMTCSFSNTTRTTTTLSINAGNPTDDLIAGTEFEYLDRARLLCRNGDRNDGLSGGERMSGVRPAVVRDNADGYAVVQPQSRLNIKFAAARTGLDWENNYKGNRDLLG